MAEPFNNALIADAISGDSPFIGNFTQTPATPSQGPNPEWGGTGSPSADAAGNPVLSDVASNFTGGTAPSTPTPGTGDFGAPANGSIGANGTGGVAPTTGGFGANSGGVAPTAAPGGAGGVPSSSSLSPFGGGDVGSFVQWYNNLDPSLATSLFTALQQAQAPRPPAGVPQLTGPVPMTVG